MIGYAYTEICAQFSNDMVWNLNRANDLCLPKRTSLFEVARLYLDTTLFEFKAVLWQLDAIRLTVSLLQTRPIVIWSNN
jgi:hypothetical protein